MQRRLVVVGASLGGLNTIRPLLASLPHDLEVALVIVMHRAKEESGDLLPLLETTSTLPVRFPLDKEPIKPGHVYVAPPNYHLLIEEDHFAYSMDAPENCARPSINVLFESAADAYGPGVTGIVLTGTKQDGADGLSAIYNHGGEALVQLPGEAVAAEMPLAALSMVPQAKQLTIKEIGEWIRCI